MMISRYSFIILALTVSFFSCKKKEAAPAPTNNNQQPEDTSGRWQPAGNVILANNGDARPFLCMDKEGNPYMIYRDGLAGNKATVVKLVAGKWDVVGVAGFSAGIADAPVMVIDDATSLPYVAYVETSTSAINKVVVMKYNGSEWQQVGKTYFQANSVCRPSIAVDKNGLPVIGYTAPPYVGIALNFDGVSWLNVFTSAPERRVYEVGVSAGNSYLSYLWDTSLSTSHLAVLQNTAGAWSDLKFPSDISPTSYSFTTDKQGMPHIAIEGKSPLRMTSVMKYDGSWTYIGDKDFSIGIGASPSIFISNDSVQTPYLTYRNGNDEPAVMSYLFTSWTNVGSKLPKDKITHSSLVVSPVDNTVYVALNTKSDGAIKVVKYKKD